MGSGKKRLGQMESKGPENLNRKKSILERFKKRTRLPPKIPKSALDQARQLRSGRGGFGLDTGLPPRVGEPGGPTPKPGAVINRPMVGEPGGPDKEGLLKELRNRATNPRQQMERIRQQEQAIREQLGDKYSSYEQMKNNIKGFGMQSSTPQQRQGFIEKRNAMLADLNKRFGITPQQPQQAAQQQAAQQQAAQQQAAQQQAVQEQAVQEQAVQQQAIGPQQQEAQMKAQMYQTQPAQEQPKPVEQPPQMAQQQPAQQPEESEEEKKRRLQAQQMA